MKACILGLFFCFGTAVEASCYDYIAPNPQLPFATDYPYPMTMQWNIVAIVEAWMLEEGIMPRPRKTSRHHLKEPYIREAQRHLGLEENGCISIEMVNMIIEAK